MNPDNRFVKMIHFLQRFVLLILCICAVIVLLATQPDLLDIFKPTATQSSVSTSNNAEGSAYWTAPDTATIPGTKEGDLIRYGRELVAHTSQFLGPKGIISASSNGMNCQNCHLKAGKKVFGNNYSAVASTYPKFRARSGSIETVEKRVNDCIERSLNGKPLPSDSREMQAFIAYISWVGKDVKKNVVPKGAGLWDLPLMNRAADPVLGKEVYVKRCEVCHGKNGEGIKAEGASEWTYPPLWGENSYNTGAGLFRLSRFAGYVKANMPNGTSFDNPQLSDEEAWDVAAYVNSLPRPVKTFREDWPDISKKPFDHPFGPFTDHYSEQQHKFGPFKPIKELQAKK